MARLLLGFLWLMALTWATYQETHQLSKEGETVNVKCTLKQDEGFYWFRQRAGHEPVFLLYISAIGKVKSEDSSFKATVSSGITTLNILKFTKENTGKYFCLALKNSKLMFGKVQEYSLPEVTTTSATTKLPLKTTEAPQISTISTTSSSRSKVTTADVWSCDFYIWVPLTGGVSLLLVILAAVSIMYCKKPRRRRCQHQFRKRPMPEENRRPPNYY